MNELHYSDCLNAIMELAGRTDSHYADDFLLHNLSQQLSKLAFCRITKVERRAVYPAHCLAKQAMTAPLHFCRCKGNSVLDRSYCGPPHFAFLAFCSIYNCCCIWYHVSLLICYLINAFLLFPQKLIALRSFKPAFFSQLLMMMPIFGRGFLV